MSPHLRISVFHPPTDLEKGESSASYIYSLSKNVVKMHTSDFKDIYQLLSLEAPSVIHVWAPTCNSYRSTTPQVVVPGGPSWMSTETKTALINLHTMFTLF